MDKEELRARIKEIQKREETRESYLVGLHFDDGGYVDLMKEEAVNALEAGENPIEALADILKNDVEEEIQRGLNPDECSGLLFQIIEDALGEVDYEYIVSFFVEEVLNESD